MVHILERNYLAHEGQYPPIEEDSALDAKGHHVVVYVGNFYLHQGINLMTVHSKLLQIASVD